MDHEKYMRMALELAAQAEGDGDVPVGCVIVKEDRVIGRGRNRREEKQHTSSHAERSGGTPPPMRRWRPSGMPVPAQGAGG